VKQTELVGVETETESADLISLQTLPASTDCWFCLSQLESACVDGCLCGNAVMRPFSICAGVCVSGLYLCCCMCVFPVCSCGTLTVGLSADQKGPCLGVEAVEIPSSIVALVFVCVLDIWLLNVISLSPSVSNKYCKYISIYLSPTVRGYMRVTYVVCYK